ncbi:MAG: Hint domain-containing protein, partial [Paracoccaceae bacterium]
MNDMATDMAERALFDPTLPRGWFGWRGDSGTVRVAARVPAARPVMATVVAELQFSGEARGETTMLRADDGNDRAFSLRVTSTGTLRVDRRSGDAVSSLSLPGAVPASGGAIMVSYSVDTLRGRSLLTAENLINPAGGLVQIDGFDPIDFDPAELSALLQPARRQRPGASAVWAGVALGQLPMAVRPGLHGSTPVLTPDGYTRIDRLSAGDKVITHDGRAAPVRWTGLLRMPAAGSFRPVRLRAPFFGQSADLIVAPYQRVLLAGPDIEYLLG